MKSWTYIILITVFLGGCSFLGSTSSEVTNLLESEEAIRKTDLSEKSSEHGEIVDPLEDELIRFFTQYFHVNEEDILALNAYPIEVDQKYWDEYTLFKSHSHKLLQGFMAPALEEKLEKQFLTTDIHFPRFVEINGNVIMNYMNVEDLHYQIVEKDEQKLTLLTDIVLKADIISKEQFNQLYSYDDKKNYYVKLNEETLLSENDQDKIKVKCSYIVELEQNEQEKIILLSLKENGEVLVPEENRREIINNDFIQRECYLEEPTASDLGLLRLFFQQFMNQDKDSYQYYQYAYDMGYDIYEQMMIDLDLRDYILLDPEQYKNQFPKTIIPTKDDIVALDIVKEDIEVGVHIDTSDKIRKYIIKIPAKAKRSDYSTSELIYSYLATVEEEEKKGSKIKSIQYGFIESSKFLEEEQGQSNELSEDEKAQIGGTEEEN